MIRRSALLEWRRPRNGPSRSVLRVRVSWSLHGRSVPTWIIAQTPEIRPTFSTRSCYVARAGLGLLDHSRATGIVDVKREPHISPQVRRGRNSAFGAAGAQHRSGFDNLLPFGLRLASRGR